MTQQAAPGLAGFATSPHTRQQRLAEPLLLESGAVLPEVDIAYRSWGRLAADGSNAIVVCHAFTGSADADEWWAPLFGAGRVFDPEQDFIVCSNVLGGCYGSTGPTTPAPDGQPWGGRFPAITIRDQVRAQMALADALGIRRIKLVIGGSMGGLQALEWAALDAQRTQAIAVIAASGRHSAWCTAWSEAQRLALAADPKYRDGYYHPADPPHAGLAAARAVAMATYRSPTSLSQRFGRAVGAEVFGDEAHLPGELAVKGWLQHHGRQLVQRFDANSYRLLLDAMDSHDLARGRGDYVQVLRGITQPALIGSIDSDALYLPREQHELARLLPAAKLLHIDSVHGHDGFLIDAAGYQHELLAFKRRCHPEQAQPASVPADSGKPAVRPAPCALLQRRRYA